MVFILFCNASFPRILCDIILLSQIIHLHITKSSPDNMKRFYKDLPMSSRVLLSIRAFSFSSILQRSRAFVGQVSTQGGNSLERSISLMRISHFCIFLSDPNCGAPKGHAFKHDLHPMHLFLTATTIPSSLLFLWLQRGMPSRRPDRHNAYKPLMPMSFLPSDTDRTRCCKPGGALSQIQHSSNSCRRPHIHNIECIYL